MINSEQSKLVVKAITRTLPNDASAEQKLWTDVICWAIRDLARTVKPRKSSNKNYSVLYSAANRSTNIENARRWIYGEVRGFKDVCALADIEPEYVRLLIKQVQETKELAA